MTDSLSHVFPAFVIGWHRLSVAKEKKKTFETHDSSLLLFPRNCFIAIIRSLLIIANCKYWPWDAISDCWHQRTCCKKTHEAITRWRSVIEDNKDELITGYWRTREWNRSAREGLWWSDLLRRSFSATSDFRTFINLTLLLSISIYFSSF